MAVTQNAKTGETVVSAAVHRQGQYSAGLR